MSRKISSGLTNPPPRWAGLELCSQSALSCCIESAVASTRIVFSNARHRRWRVPEAVATNAHAWAHCKHVVRRKQTPHNQSGWLTFINRVALLFAQSCVWTSTPYRGRINFNCTDQTNNFDLNSFDCFRSMKINPFSIPWFVFKCILIHFVPLNRRRMCANL